MLKKPSFEAQRAIRLAKDGHRSAAIEAALAAAENDPQDGGLRLFLGLLLTRENRLGEAIEQFRSAIALQPHDMIARVELARLLIGFDEIKDAQAVLGPVPRGPARDRVEALVHRRRGDHGRAAAIYRHAVAADPRDFESWGHLGICLLAMGRPVEAGEALTRSLTLRRDQQQIREKWATPKSRRARARKASSPRTPSPAIIPGTYWYGR